MLTLPTYFEIASGRAPETAAFFQQIFGCTFTPTERAGEGWFDLGSVRIGLHGNDPSNHIVPYFHVPNLELAVEHVRRTGGIVEPQISSEEGFGRFANCRDPAGIAFGLHES